MEITSILEFAGWLLKQFKRRKLLLAVEDNSDDALLLRDELKAARIGYVIARSAEEALGLMKNVKFDAAMIDIGLPMMDGIELSKHIEDAYPKTRIFFVTGSSFINLEEGELFRVIRKPVTAKAIRKMVL